MKALDVANEKDNTINIFGEDEANTKQSLIMQYYQTVATA